MMVSFCIVLSKASLEKNQRFLFWADGDPKLDNTLSNGQLAKQTYRWALCGWWCPGCPNVWKINCHKGLVVKILATLHADR